MKTIAIGKYKHYTGYICEVLYVAKMHDTLEPMVVYKGLWGEGEVRIRPAKDWNHTVFVNKQPVHRYELIAE